MLELPPLSLYVHLPWCVRKCPYCDFNSHAVEGTVPAAAYTRALLADLENDLPLAWGRPVHSVFFGGGTPSLFGADPIARIIEGIRSRVPLAPAAEITLEANPGTVEHDSFHAYREAGINRVSLGVQSFDDARLAAIGRIHGGREAEEAVAAIRRAGIMNFNIDLMFGLPGQTVGGAVRDVEAALGFEPAHLSHYQLTLETNTAFHAHPPPLPAEDDCWEMQQACATRLEAAGYAQYEISAWARPGAECRHNLNYWRYGDYLGIGAGAHAKITDPAGDRVLRIAKHRHPRAYLGGLDSGDWRSECRSIAAPERSFEFFLNQLRLREGVRLQDFSPRTGLPLQAAGPPIAEARRRGLAELRGERLLATDLGWRFVNDVQALFLPADAPRE